MSARVIIAHGPAGIESARTAIVAGESCYVGEDDRFVVVLAVGYNTERDEVATPESAVLGALELTRDLGSHDTQWLVYDRLTGESEVVEQGEVEGDG